MQRGHGAGVAGVHGLQHIQRFRAAALAEPAPRVECKSLDSKILGRAVGCELPADAQSRLEPHVKRISDVAGNFLRASASALRARLGPPDLAEVESVFHDYTEEFSAVRRDGLIRAMTSEAAERFYALGFALEQFDGCSPS